MFKKRPIINKDSTAKISDEIVGASMKRIKESLITAYGKHQYTPISHPKASFAYTLAKLELKEKEHLDDVFSQYEIIMSRMRQAANDE